LVVIKEGVEFAPLFAIYVKCSIVVVEKEAYLDALFAWCDSVLNAMLKYTSSAK
jgi:hypothetical protein